MATVSSGITIALNSTPLFFPKRAKHPFRDRMFVGLHQTGYGRFAIRVALVLAELALPFQSLDRDLEAHHASFHVPPEFVRNLGSVRIVVSDHLLEML